MKNNCWLCGGTRDHFEMWDLAMGDRIIYFGFSCLNDILTQHVLDFESKDKAMSERANRHEAEYTECPNCVNNDYVKCSDGCTDMIEEPITIPNDKGIPIKHARDCQCDDCRYFKKVVR